jgi:pilus assembly protein CpaE
MSGKPPSKPASGDGEKKIITVLLVDDMPDTREMIKKMLSFEPEFRVVGSAGNGREGVSMVKELRPDIVIMDINMPDMDGLEAASRITKAVPTTGVIMMSVQDDPDYMQKAMLAGARFFLNKPVEMDRLHTTVRSVYEQYEPIRRQFEALRHATSLPVIDEEKTGGGNRHGHIIVVYSPIGGSGKTTIATSLASGLMKEGVKTLLVDANLEFGDCGAFLDLRTQTTLMEAIENVGDLDIDYFESIVATHNSGMKVLLAPPNPSLGMDLRADNPEVVKEMLEQIASYYDFIVVDTSSLLDAVVASLLNIASLVVLVTLPNLPAIKNTRLLLKTFQETGFELDKVALVLNRVPENSARTAKTNPTPDKVQSYLGRPLEGTIPLVDETFILTAVMKGVPVVAVDRDTSKPPIRQLLRLADHLYNRLMGISEENTTTDTTQKKGSGWGLFGGNR